MPRARPQKTEKSMLGKRGDKALDEVMEEDDIEPELQKKTKDSLSQQAPRPEPTSAQKDPVKEQSESSMRKVKVLNGRIPVDDFVPNKDCYQVYSSFKTSYSKTLVVSDIENNSNKFYIVQLLEDPKTKKYYTFYRWGRIGNPGQVKLNSFGVGVAQAIADFDTKVASKLEDGEYTEVIVDFGADDAEEKDKDDKMQEALSTSKTNPEVAELIKSLFSIKMFTQQVKEIGYDVKRMPLGNLSQKAIVSANQKLVTLLEFVRKTDKELKNKKKLISELSSEFYRDIPHDFGHNHMSRNILDTNEKIQDKLDLLEMLKKIKVAQGMTSGDEAGNSIDIHYNKLNTKITPLDSSHQTFKLLQNYAESSIAPNHAGLKIKIDAIFELEKASEQKCFTENLGNRLLLFHGSRMTNFAGILSQGLIMPSSDVPNSSFSFGRGLYFQDTFSKAVLSCFPHLSNGVCYVLVSEVALGVQNKMFYPDSSAGTLPDGTDSTQGCGRIGPDEANAQLLDKVKLLVGPVRDTAHKNSSLQFNEYVIYNNAQCKMRYLIRCTSGK